MFSYIFYDPTGAKNPQGTPITASFFDHIKAAMRYCIMHRFHPIFYVDLKDIIIIIQQKNTPRVRQS
jgi:hypothetical protein